MTLSIVNAADTSALLSQVGSFLSNNGWAVSSDASGGWGTPADGQISVTSPSGYHFNAYADLAQRIVYTTISDAAGSTANDMGDQPSESKPSHTNFPSDNYQNVYLFTDADAFYCVVEYAASRFRHFAFGVLDKAGGDAAWPGGEFSVGTYWHQHSGYIGNIDSSRHQILWDARATYFGIHDYTQDNIVRFKEGASIYDRAFGRSGYADSNLHNYAYGAIREGESLFSHSTRHGTSVETGYTALQPIHIGARNVANTFFMPLGSVRNVRACRLDSYNPKDTVTIGSDTWHIFPLTQKNGGEGEESSGLYGVAYKA